MNFKALLAIALTTATITSVVPKAEATPRNGIRAAQYELCDAGGYYADDVRNGWMNQQQAIEEGAMYASDLRDQNGWGPEVHDALSGAVVHGYYGGNCNIYK